MELNALLKELEKLKLPKDQYVITSSAALAVHGLRDPHDIDIIVSDELWKKLTKENEVNELPFKSIKLSKHVEVLSSVSHFVDPKIISPRVQLKDPDIINGYPYVKLEILKRFKELGKREKDIKDVKIIEEFLAV